MRFMTFAVSPGGGGWELFGQERQIDSLWERFALALCAERKHKCFCVIMVIVIKINSFYQ